jgi:hypothetical protein
VQVQLFEPRCTDSPQLAARELEDYISLVVDQVILDDNDVSLDVSFRICGQELAQLYGTVALSDHHCLVCFFQ